MEQMDQISVEQEDALSNQERIDLAQRSIDDLAVEKPTEEFPGAEAYKKVMKVVVLAEADDRTIENWQSGYEELKDKYQALDEEEIDRDAWLEENKLHSMLQGALDSAQRKMSEEEAA